jgi:phage-related minor tail protein
MGKAEQVTDKTAKNMDSAGKQAGGLGSGFGSAAKQAGILAAGLGAFDIGKAAIGGLFGAMESGTKTVGSLQAQLGLTKDEAEALGKVGTEVFRNNFAGSMGEAAAAAGKVQQILGVMDTSSLQTATENAFRLSDAFGVDTADSLSAVKTLMDNFGLSSEQAFDLVTSGFQKGLNRSGDFLDTINEYGTQFKNNGFSAEQFFNVLDSGLQGGVLGTDKAADAVKEFGIRFTEMAGPVRTALGDIGLNADDLAAKVASGQITQAEAFEMVIGALGQVDDKTKQYAAGQALLGTQFEDLGVDAALALSTVGTSLDETAGKTQALDAQYTGIGNTIESLKRKALTGFLQPLADQMGGVMNAAIPLIGALGSLGLAIPALLPVIGPVVAILAGPLTLAIVGIGAAIAVLVLAWTQNWGDIQGKTQAAINFISPIIDGLGDRLREFGEVILPELAAAWQNLSDQVGTIANGIRDIVEPIFNGIRDFLNAHRTEITAILQGAWDAIVVIVNTVTGIISNNIQFWLNILQGDWDAAWQNVKNIVSITWDGIKQLAEIFLSTVLPAVITIGMDALKALWNLAWNEIKASVDTAINGENGVIALVRAMPGAILAALAGIGTLLFQVGADLIQGFIDGARSLGDTLISTVRGFVQGAIDAAWDVIRPGSPSQEGHDIMTNFFQGMISGASDLGGALKDKVMSIVQEAISGAMGAAREAAGGILSGAADLGRGALGAVGIGGGGGGGGGGGEWAQIAGNIANQYGLPPALVAAMAWHESGGGNLNAVGDSGNSFGLFQMHVPAHGGSAATWTGAEGAYRGAAVMSGRWISAFNALGGMAAYTADPEGFLMRWAPQAQGSIAWDAAMARRAMAAARAAGYARGGTVKSGWGVVGEQGWEAFHLGPGGLTIFPHELSKAMMPMGGAPGYQSGAGVTATSQLIGGGLRAVGVSAGGATATGVLSEAALMQLMRAIEQFNARARAGLLDVETYNAHLKNLIDSFDQLASGEAIRISTDDFAGISESLYQAAEALGTIPPLLTNEIQPSLGEVTGDIGKMTTEVGKIPPLISNELLPVLSTTESRMDLVSGASGGMAKSLDAVGSTASKIAAGPFFEVDTAIQSLIKSFTEGTISAEEYDKAMQGLQQTAAKIAKGAGGFPGGSAIGAIAGHAAGGTVRPGWFTVGERGFELGHLGPGGLQIFSNEASKALIGQPGGMTGYQGGSNTKAEMFAAAVASPGGWTPALAQAWFEGMEQIAKGMEEETREMSAVSEEVYRRLMRQAAQFSTDLGTEANKLYTEFAAGLLSAGDLIAELRALLGSRRGRLGAAGEIQPQSAYTAPMQVILQVDGRQLAQAVTPAISGEIAMTVQSTSGAY